MKLSHAIFVTVLDGNKHRVRDVMGYLRTRVDPAVAVRAYTRTIRREDRGNKGEPINAPLAYQIQKGQERAVTSSLFPLVRKGYVSLEYDPKRPNSVMNAWVEITPLGRAVCRKTQKGNTGGGVLKELRRLYLAGKIELHPVFLDTIADAFVEDEDDASAQPESPHDAETEAVAATEDRPAPGSDVGEPGGEGGGDRPDADQHGRSEEPVAGGSSWDGKILYLGNGF